MIAKYVYLNWWNKACNYLHSNANNMVSNLIKTFYNMCNYKSENMLIVCRYYLFFLVYRSFCANKNNAITYKNSILPANKLSIINGSFIATVCPIELSESLKTGFEENWNALKEIESFYLEAFNYILEKESKSVVVSLTSENDYEKYLAKGINIKPHYEIIQKKCYEHIIFSKWYDGASPDYDNFQELLLILEKTYNYLEEGFTIICHCKGGIGRTGSLAALLMAMGELNNYDNVKIEDIEGIINSSLKSVRENITNDCHPINEFQEKAIPYVANTKQRELLVNLLSLKYLNQITYENKNDYIPGKVNGDILDILDCSNIISEMKEIYIKQ